MGNTDDIILSVIIPVYNAEKSIRRAIDSALDQKELAVEVIAINDGSTDHTQEIMDKLYGANQNVRIYHRTNHGPYKSRVYGIGKAKGKYITFMDADDYISPGFYRPVLKYMAGKNADIVEFGSRIYSESMELVTVDYYSYEEKKNIEAMKNVMLKKNCSCSDCNKIYRSALFDIRKMNVDVFTYEEDLLLNIFAMQNAEKIITIPMTGYNYCRHSDSFTTGGITCGLYKALHTWKYIYKECGKYKELERTAAMAYCAKIAYFYCLLVTDRTDISKYNKIVDRFHKIYKKNHLSVYFGNGESVNRLLMVRLFWLNHRFCRLVFRMFVIEKNNYEEKK